MYSRPAYCTVLTLNAGRFIAKAGDFTDSDGTFFGPISMLVNGEWMDRADFEEKFGILRSEDYRKEEAMPGTIWPKKKDITEIETTKPTDTTITTTFTKQEEPLPLPEVTPEMKNAADAAFRSLSTTFTLQADYGYPKIFASTDFNAPAFGTRIQLYRESLILSRRKAAAQMNINESAVAAIEAGTYHGIDEIAKAAKWVGLTASEMGAFFGLEDPNKPERSWSGTTTILILLFILTWILVWNL
ncbi:MAG: XRE family transcriptional regulator [Alphaproteobacteria bacterium]|nr:XRE family transcriptional regulator [Alphaproteobacteria bacterium]